QRRRRHQAALDGLDEVDTGEPGPGFRKRWVDLERFPVSVFGALQVSGLTAVEKKPAEQVTLVYPTVCELTHVSAVERSTQRPCDRARDLALRGEDIVELSIVRDGPELHARFRIDETRRDANPVAGRAQAALEH